MVGTSEHFKRPGLGTSRRICLRDTARTLHNRFTTYEPVSPGTEIEIAALSVEWEVCDIYGTGTPGIKVDLRHPSCFRKRRQAYQNYCQLRSVL